MFGVNRVIDFKFPAFVCPGFKSFASTSSKSAKEYAPSLQLQFPQPTLNEAHDRRCEWILEMDGLTSVKKAWSFASSLALRVRS